VCVATGERSGMRAPFATSGDDCGPPLSRQVDVWVVRLSVDDQTASGAGVFLNEEERIRAQTYRNLNDQHRFIARRTALRNILGDYLDLPPYEVEVCSGPYGKPFVAQSVAGQSVQFSASHSFGLAVIAVTTGSAVGVDVERLRPLPGWWQVVQMGFSSAEQAWLRSVPQSDQLVEFFIAWTMKEACAKACGMGLRLDVRTVEVAVEQKGTPLPVRIGNGSVTNLWSLRPVPLAGHALALAVEGLRDLRLELRHWQQV
jgi:4'-phosphopantetheinyl transferase